MTDNQVVPWQVTALDTLANGKGHFEISAYFNGEEELYMVRRAGQLLAWYTYQLWNDRGVYLRKFFMLPHCLQQLPAVFQAILAVTGRLKQERLYIYSQQLLTDLLLKEASFQKVQDATALPKQVGIGNWWVYRWPTNEGKVSSSTLEL